jgi:hypothetical protein
LLHLMAGVREKIAIFNIVHIPCSQLDQNMYSNNCTAIKRQYFINMCHSCYMFRPAKSILKEVVNEEKSSYV